MAEFFRGLADITPQSMAVDMLLSMFLAHEWDNCVQYAIERLT